MIRIARNIEEANEERGILHLPTEIMLFNITRLFYGVY
jgi:hypothetical protein